MANYEVSCKTLIGKTVIPASKSYAHRILIACALCDSPTKVMGYFAGEDVAATKSCLISLGAKITEISGGLYVEHIKLTDKTASLHVNESGSTLRFLLPIAAALGITASFSANGRLNARPIKDLIDSLLPHGASADSGALPLTISGKLTSGIYKIPGNISSQYITGLLLALPVLDGDSQIIIEGETVSRGYIDVTLEVIKDFGIKIDQTEKGYFVKGGQRYISPKIICVEGDWSSACFFAVGGVLSGRTVLTGLNANSKQSDRVIVDLLSKAGADIKETDEGFIFNKSNLSAIDFCAENCPDIVPIMSVALSRACGISKISGVERLIHKESDRLQGVITMLSSLGIEARYQDNALTITGGELEYKRPLSGNNDHRMVMSGAIAVCGSKIGAVIEGVAAIDKSYPSFFEVYKKMGGTVDVLQPDN